VESSAGVRIKAAPFVADQAASSINWCECMGELFLNEISEETGGEPEEPEGTKALPAAKSDRFHKGTLLQFECQSNSPLATCRVYHP
jgi:hypothetical protein